MDEQMNGLINRWVGWEINEWMDRCIMHEWMDDAWINDQVNECLGW